MKNNKEINKNILELKEKINPILEKNDIVKSSVFGSFARGEEKKDSDIDILIELKKPKGLLFLVGLKFELEDILKRKVDLLTYESIHPKLKKYIYKDEVVIYEKR